MYKTPPAQSWSVPSSEGAEGDECFWLRSGRREGDVQGFAGAGLRFGFSLGQIFQVLDYLEENLYSAVKNYCVA